MSRPLPAAAFAFACALLVLAVPLAGAPEESRVQATGLRAPVSVTTDRWGIPHVRALSLDDLYFAWGWVSARDRLWQMVFTRAAADGQTHRWLGNAALQADGGAQLFRLRERAHAIWQRDRADGLLRMQLERYAAGVNAYLNECRRGERAWPAELTRLRERPRDWTAEDCVAVLLGFGITLDLDLSELDEARAVADSGAVWYVNRNRYENRWMYDTVPDSAGWRMWPRGSAAGVAAARGVHALPASPLNAGARPRLPAELLAAAGRVLAAFPPHDRDGASRASNEFVIGAKRSASGKPVLANDPHLALGNPGPFHVLHVSIPGALEAIGADVPGLPLIVSGRNTHAAWGVTALSADVIDVYADTLSGDGKRVRRHLGNGRTDWVPVETKGFSMSFRVFGVPLPVLPFMSARRYTPHGPVLVWNPKQKLALAARWTAMEDARITLRRIVGLERSASAAEVCERTATLVTPCLNIVAADVNGDTRYQSAGLLPVRAHEPGPGPIPSNGAYEWTGFVPTEQMPHWRVPASGYAVNANNRPVGRPYPWPLPRYDWAHDRARRMAQRLDGDKSITLNDAASVQNDIYSLAAERNLRHLLECADSLYSVLPPRSKAAVETLRVWDLRARRSRVAPTLYRAWFGAFQRRSRIEGFSGLALAALMSRAPEALRVPGLSSSLERPAVAACAALSMAIDTLTTRFGPDMHRWTYGRAHAARFRHPLSALDTRARWEPPLTPEDGDNSTPSVGASRLPWSIEVGHGAAFRHVVDLARPGISFGVVPPWNSAAFTPTGDRDLRQRWADHGYVPFLLDWARIGAVAIDRVTLAP
jgi:penicillin amidase